jgi:hypothetical protein
MSRCNRRDDLVVHHKQRGKGNRLSNATVLCRPCLEKTPFYGLSGPTPEPFTEATRQEALRRAGNRCQCKSSRDCH